MVSGNTPHGDDSGALSARAEIFVHPSAEIEAGAQIGAGTKLWQYVHVRAGASIGVDCSFGRGVYIDTNVVIGDRVKVQNGVSIYEGVTLEDDVFVGPHTAFTNDLYPRSFSEHWEKIPTRVKRGASIAAHATLVCGFTIGEYAMVAAGAVVSSDVPPFGLVVGNPARLKGYVDKAGKPIKG